MGLISVVVMSALLGAAAFGIGNLPLFFTFSRSRLQYLSTLGTGLLLGASLGIVIPEGVETITKDSINGEVPTNIIALCLLSGFAFMMIVEQFISGHSHEHEHNSPPVNDGSLERLYENGASPDSSVNYGGDNTPKPVENEDYDVQLENLDRGNPEGWVEGSTEERKALAKRKAYPLTLGLVIHSLADGLALGASALPLSGTDGEGSASSTGLSLIVFLALIIHKAPTALALSMSLISSSLPRSECRKHIAYFSLSTPLGALASYGILSTIGTGGSWTGIALLISGGTFLYVATVLQPLSHSEETAHTPALPSANMGEKTRALLVILGMFIPFVIGIVVGPDH